VHSLGVYSCREWTPMVVGDSALYWLRLYNLQVPAPES